VSIFFRGRQQQRFYDPNAIPLNGQVGRYGPSTNPVSQESALRVSAVWAAMRLRANLISTLPVEAYRMVGDVQVTVNGPNCTFMNAGRVIDVTEFLYATQFDLDRSGNAFGVILERNALGQPAVIELINLADITVRPRRVYNPIDPDWIYDIRGVEYDRTQIWHEKQYVVSGLGVGLSPIAYGAWAIGSYSNAQEFAQRWYGQDAMPAAVLRNVERTVPPKVAAAVKSAYQASMSPGGIFVTGSDWELKPMNAAMETNRYIETMQFGVPDIARYFDVPADLIDGAVSGSSVTYANITQRNLQLLIMHLGPAIVRREKALSQLVPGQRFVKLNTDAILRMDPLTKAQVFKTEIDSRSRTPDEAREKNNLPPLTQAQKDQFKELFPGKAPSPAEDQQPPEGGAPDDPATAGSGSQAGG
jgi:HK97 family phage portal protein